MIEAYWNGYNVVKKKIPFSFFNRLWKGSSHASCAAINFSCISLLDGSLQKREIWVEDIFFFTFFWSLIKTFWMSNERRINAPNFSHELSVKLNLPYHGDVVVNGWTKGTIWMMEFTGDWRL